MPAKVANSVNVKPNKPFVREAAEAFLPSLVAVLFVQFAFSKLPFVRALGGTSWHDTLFLSAYFAVVVLVEFARRGLAKWWQRRTAVSSIAPSLPKRRLGLFATLVLIPLVISVLGNVVTINGEGLVHLLLTRDRMDGIEAQISNAVLTAKETETKTVGIEALGSLHSNSALGEMIRILDKEQICFEDYLCEAATIRTLASFSDLSVKDALVGVLLGHLQQAKVSNASFAQGIHQRYFKSTFDALRGDMARDAPDGKSAEQMATRLAQIESGLRAQLGDIQSSIPSQGGPATVVTTILKAYVVMPKLDEDQYLLKKAKEIASDEQFSTPIRRAALSLVGKLGNKGESLWIAQFLNKGDEKLRAGALVALDVLFKKITKTNQKQPDSDH